MLDGVHIDTAHAGVRLAVQVGANQNLKQSRLSR
jgi:hypothetical protein